MPKRLKRYYGSGYLHFITSSCYQRRPLLGSSRRRDLFLETLEQVRRRYDFIVVGYVVMPEHFHLLMSEPESGNPSTVMQVLKQRFARKLLRSAQNSSLESDRIWRVAQPFAAFCEGWGSFDFMGFVLKPPSAPSVR